MPIVRGGLDEQEADSTKQTALLPTIRQMIAGRSLLRNLT